MEEKKLLLDLLNVRPNMDSLVDSHHEENSLIGYPLQQNTTVSVDGYYLYSWNRDLKKKYEETSEALYRELSATVLQILQAKDIREKIEIPIDLASKLLSTKTTQLYTPEDKKLDREIKGKQINESKEDILERISKRPTAMAPEVNDTLKERTKLYESLESKIEMWMIATLKEISDLKLHIEASPTQPSRIEKALYGVKSLKSDLSKMESIVYSLLDYANPNQNLEEPKIRRKIFGE